MDVQSKQSNLLIAVDSNVKAKLIAIQVAAKIDTVFFCT